MLNSASVRPASFWSPRGRLVPSLSLGGERSAVGVDQRVNRRIGSVSKQTASIKRSL